MHCHAGGYSKGLLFLGNVGGLGAKGAGRRGRSLWLVRKVWQVDSPATAGGAVDIDGCRFRAFEIARLVTHLQPHVREFAVSRPGNGRPTLVAVKI